MNSEEFRRHWEAAATPPKDWQGNLKLTTSSGHIIRHGYAPAHGETKGTIVITHGYGEHIDLYYETIKKYQDRGYEVFAMDWHGHGKSSRADSENPRRASSLKMERHVDDLNDFINQIVIPQKHEDSQSLIMSTNSMGGHVGLRYLKQYDDVFDAAVMSTPMFDIVRKGMPEAVRPALRMLFNAASKVGLKNWEIPTGQNVSRKVEKMTEKSDDVKMTDLSGLNIRSYIADMIRAFHPDAKIGEPTVGWIASAYRSISPTMDEDYLKSIKTPILIGSAGRETLVSNQAHRKVASLTPNAELIEIPSATHVLWLETDENHKEWWDSIDSFLERNHPDLSIDSTASYSEDTKTRRHLPPQSTENRHHPDSNKPF